MEVATTVSGRTPYITRTITISDICRLKPLLEQVAPPPPVAPVHTPTKSSATSSLTTSPSNPKPATASTNHSSKSPTTSPPSSDQIPSTATSLTPGEEWPIDKNVGSSKY